VKVIKPAYLIASFPLTQPPPGTETSAKGCLVSTETPCVASTKGWKPTMGHFQIINSRNGVKITYSIKLQIQLKSWLPQHVSRAPWGTSARLHRDSWRAQHIISVCIQYTSAAFRNHHYKAINMHQFDLRFWPSWVAWLLCLPPTFPIVRLGGKGSTSVIVTSGSSGLVPQTGWSRKLVILRI
jgi:hypothetical protein